MINDHLNLSIEFAEVDSSTSIRSSPHYPRQSSPTPFPSPPHYNLNSRKIASSVSSRSTSASSLSVYFDCPSHQTVTSHEGNEDEKPERPRLSSSDLPPTYSRARLDHMLSEGQYEITPLPHLNNILPPSRDLATLPKRKSSSHGKIRPQATSRPSWAIPSPVKPSLSLDLVTHAKACWV